MQTENRLMVMWGAGEESGMNGERNMETYTLQTARGNLLYGKELKLGLCNNLEG